MQKHATTLILVAALALFTTSCSDETNPLAAFEPEIVNDADAFQFQITDATNVSVTRSWTWNNTATRGTVDHSTALTGGSATVVIQDAAGLEVYRSAMMASANEQTSAGTAGDWTVTVVFSDFDGTANFRVEKL